MNLSNIKVGDTYKNYKAICEALEEAPKAGNTKVAQLKEWECHFNFEKQGHKFIIKEIYETPLVKQDLRSQGNNAAVYIEEIEQLILDLLAQDSHNGELFLSRSRLLKELKMINENYTYYRNQKHSLSKFMNIDIEEINDFYELSNSTFKSNLETALNRLQKQSLIYWNYALTVCYIDTSIALTDTGQIKAIKREVKTEDGEIVTTYDTVKPVQELAYRKATKDEIRIILDIERSTLKHFDCEEKSDLFKKGKQEEFYKFVKDLVFEKTNIVFYYNSFEIIFNDKHIKEKLDSMRLDEINKYVSQSILNSSVIDKLSTNAQNRYEKALNDSIMIGLDNEDKLHPKIKMRSRDSYLSNNGTLTDSLINKDMVKLVNIK
ncbi:hypothetical protein [Bacillus infantis]|uniref:hypothetical protein n=1 Tax=Bacillus infantis TaxID=324767 RepID=UPI0020A1F144|nr:hypothetical protein [Bacillus infantis]MCP1159403.1 hypothetical protein [Bacillus infantis]